MKNELSTEELQEVERQLRCPSGANGIKIGHLMHATNLGMTLNAMQAMQIKPGNSILEIGHGNGGHIETILAQAPNLSYMGIDISQTMHDEAKANIRGLSAELKLYEGSVIPFPDDSFDRTMSVNTIYFWQEPVHFIREIERTLKPGGICALAFAQKEYLKTLPFVGQRFTIYGETDFNNLIGHTNLTLASITTHADDIKSKTGESTRRAYHVASLIK